MRDTKPILLIEDDRIDAMTVKRALKERCVDASLHHVCDGEQALELLRTGDEPMPCVILLDLYAPKMDGFEFLRIVKSDNLLKDIPVVVLSGSCEQGSMDRAFSLGACDYLVKSTDYAEFSKSFGSLERFWADEVELPVRG